MHVFGFSLHPLTAPIANELSQCVGMSVKQLVMMYVAVVKPEIEDFMFLWNHL